MPLSARVQSVSSSHSGTTDTPEPSVVAFIEAGTADGGSTSWLLSALRCLDRQSFSPVVIFYYAAGGATVEKIRALGVPIYFASAHPPDYFPESLRHRGPALVRKFTSLLRVGYRHVVRDGSITRNVRKLLRQTKASAVVLNADLHLHYCGAIAAHYQHLPIMCRKSGGIGEGRRIKKYLTPWIDVFVPISRAAEQDQLSNKDTKRSVLVYEGVDVWEYNGQSRNPSLRQQLGIPANKKVVTSVARLEEGKGQQELLESAPKVIEQLKDVVFLIVGEETPPNGPITASLHATVERLGIKDHVIFTGARGDVADILAITDVFVHCPTTWIEGLGICHLEAMSSSKPSVISNNGGLPEAASDGVTGFVVPPGDTDRMAASILNLLTDEALAQRFGTAARARAEQLFDIVSNNTFYHKLLLELVSKHNQNEEEKPAMSHKVSV
jgi:glycosyltransferase involved in cell wall biosynthesis